MKFFPCDIYAPQHYCTRQTIELWIVWSLHICDSVFIFFPSLISEEAYLYFSLLWYHKEHAILLYNIYCQTRESILHFIYLYGQVERAECLMKVSNPEMLGAAVRWSFIPYPNLRPNRNQNRYELHLNVQFGRNNNSFCRFTHLIHERSYISTRTTRWRTREMFHLISSDYSLITLGQNNVFSRRFAPC